MTSESWLKTLKLTRQLEEKEDMLTEKYKERKLKVEKDALEKMKSNPRYFYCICQSLIKKTKAQLEPWLTKMENFATLLLKRVNVSENNLNQSSRNQTLTL